MTTVDKTLNCDKFATKNNNMSTDFIAKNRLKEAFINKIEGYVKLTNEINKDIETIMGISEKEDKVKEIKNLKRGINNNIREIYDYFNLCEINSGISDLNFVNDDNHLSKCSKEYAFSNENNDINFLIEKEKSKSVNSKIKCLLKTGFYNKKQKKSLFKLMNALNKSSRIFKRVNIMLNKICDTNKNVDTSFKKKNQSRKNKLKIVNGRNSFKNLQKICKNEMHFLQEKLKKENLTDISNLNKKTSHLVHQNLKEIILNLNQANKTNSLNQDNINTTEIINPLSENLTSTITNNSDFIMQNKQTESTIELIGNSSSLINNSGNKFLPLNITSEIISPKYQKEIYTRIKRSTDYNERQMNLEYINILLVIILLVGVIKILYKKIKAKKKIVDNKLTSADTTT